MSDWWHNVDWAQVLFDLRMEDAQVTDSPDELDCRNVKPNPLIWPTTPKPAAPLTPAQAGIARAVAKLSGGADVRYGCGDYEPEM